MRGLSAALLVVVLVAPVLAQETGSVSGRVTLEDGTRVPGVTITAAGEVLPQERMTVSSATGDYRFSLLPPGSYVLTFELDGTATELRSTNVLLEQTVVINVTMSAATVTEVLQVTAADESLETQSTALSATVSDRVITALPVGQEYRDLVKLAPGIMYTENVVRGPSVGGNGQDNVYKLDGVDVTLPLFGTLPTEPAAYDIEQVSFLQGGARAVDFNRSGGMTMNSVTRSGTNRWRGFLGYRIQTDDLTASREQEGVLQFEGEQSWLTLGLGGPVLRDKLFVYGSYYRPEGSKQNKANVYGEVPDFETRRDEYFAKLTWTPTRNLLLSGSYRSSERDDEGSFVCVYCQGTTSSGNDEAIDIGFVEGSWLIDSRSSLSLKYGAFDNRSGSIPDNLLDTGVGPGMDLDVDGLERQGSFRVPVLREGNAEFNEAALPVIERYGYLENGEARGGGRIGVAPDISDQQFSRDRLGLSYDHLLGIHQLHFGYERYEVSETLRRASNGWGRISFSGGIDTTDSGQPYYYYARFAVQTLAEVVPQVVSSMESQSVELNDTITLDDWTVNVGVILSNDTLFGSGLRETGEGVSGYEVASGNRYEMVDIGFGDMIQPRLGVTWSWNGREKAFASYARYHPAASSLPRAASWDRNIALLSVRYRFDRDGTFLEQDPIPGSSGKWFQDGIEPRSIDEFLIGYDRQLPGRWIARSHFRYREAANFWEDTNNDGRLRFDPPPGIPRQLYVPNLAEIRAEIGGSSYVIAQLDEAFTEFYEVALEAEYRTPKTYLRGSYVWSQYYGNFDQDGTNSFSDNNVFIGSSFIADGGGRQVWNYRYGYLQGDQRHRFKLYGTYSLRWDGIIGAWMVYQDGQPWQVCDVEPYREYTGSVNESSRYAEPAGSRRTDDHYQLDLSYTQRFSLGGRYSIQLRADLFNVFDRQTGLDIQQLRHSAAFGEPLRYFDPRRLQLAVSFEF